MNEIHFTTEKDCLVAAVEELVGGTANNYSEHILETVNSLCETYSHFNGKDKESTKKQILENNSNSFTNRFKTYRAALCIISFEWNRPINELNCHLHPLDIITSSVQSPIKKCKTEKGELYQTDCMAANVVIAINKLCYKDGKGDPAGFLYFLNKNKLPSGLLPSYRGNHLHILFLLGGVLI